MYSLIIDGFQHSINCILASSISTGHTEDWETYISELPGLSHYISMVENICLKHNIIEGSITTPLNGIEAIKKQHRATPVYPDRKQLLYHLFHKPQDTCLYLTMEMDTRHRSPVRSKSPP